MQSLSVADHLIDNVESGNKQIAIRIGVVSIKPGPLEVKSASGLWGSVKVNVEKVEMLAITELTTEQLRACGYSSIQGLLSAQRACYPCINENTEVSVIFWR